ncbi:hypothetical protein [Azospirillum agricola]|uniref:hypothetical protein n=1 Tax=Azospirillum agricola TaxID=1720247 RepID=UPI001178624A|nr:hypothetical protein [Azospirillum agricola]
MSDRLGEDRDDEESADDVEGGFEGEFSEEDCPTCNGSGYDPQDGGQCEDCYGTGIAGEASR